MSAALGIVKVNRTQECLAEVGCRKCVDNSTAAYKNASHTRQSLRIWRKVHCNRFLPLPWKMSKVLTNAPWKRVKCNAVEPKGQRLHWSRGTFVCHMLDIQRKWWPHIARPVRSIAFELCFNMLFNEILKIYIYICVHYKQMTPTYRMGVDFVSAVSHWQKRNINKYWELNHIFWQWHKKSLKFVDKNKALATKTMDNGAYAYCLK